MRRLLALAVLCAACTSADNGGLPPLPDFVDDCGEALNDGVGAAAGLLTADGERYDSVQLCAGEVDFYRIDVPPGTYVAVEAAIDGSGRGPTDLDLYEVDEAGAEVWFSAAAQPYERLAWFNPGLEPKMRFLRLEGYDGAQADYSLLVRTSEFHEGLDCDAFYPEDPSGPAGHCNQILQFPETVDDPAAGYWVEHEAHYSNLRREVAYLVRYAAGETMAAIPETGPLALMDMSERDGSTPGTMVNQLRHPEGTHIEGNDIDIAYYQNGPDNGGRPVCANNGYFCTGPANKLDARRTAYFVARLLDSQNVRVIGMDPVIAEAVGEAAWDLVDEGLLEATSAQKVNGPKIAYGDGWPFHHHHMHLSWRWEQGSPLRTDGAALGCMTGPGLYPGGRGD